GPRSSAGQAQADAQASLGRILERDLAALAAGEVARDRQAETQLAAARVARGIEAEERPKHRIALRLRNARPVIIDENVEAVAQLDPGHPDMLAVAARIADEIGDAAPRRVGAQQQNIALGEG